MEQEPGLKRSRSGDCLEHRHRNGWDMRTLLGERCDLGREGETATPTLLGPARTQKGGVRDRGSPLLGEGVLRNWEIQDSPQFSNS